MTQRMTELPAAGRATSPETGEVTEGQVEAIMAERGRPKPPLVLTDEERQTLERWSRRAKTAQALALRPRSCWPAPTV